MFVLIRAVTYATLFCALFLVFLPVSVLSEAGVDQPRLAGIPQIAGMLLAAAGAVTALWCVGTFAVVGRGTPAPFDPPRRLVVNGPYRFVRNPMYLGATVALGGAALFYQSLALLGYAAAFFAVVHLFAIACEEPALRRTFGNEYENYCRRVHRWLPRS